MRLRCKQRQWKLKLDLAAKKDTNDVNIFPIIHVPEELQNVVKEISYVEIDESLDKKATKVR